MRFVEKKIAFFVFIFFMLLTRETEKRKNTKWKRPKNPIRICVCQRWSSKNEKNVQKWIFLQKLPDTICVRKGRKGEKSAHFRAHYSVLAKNFGGPKQ